MLGIFLLTTGACDTTDELYQKTYSPAEQEQLATQLLSGVGGYYQGSPATQMTLREALEYDPTNAAIVREIGVPYLKRGIVAEFPDFYGKAAEMDPVGWTGWRGYLYLYFYRDYERALADFNATDTLTPNVVDYPQSLSVDFMRGICYLQLGQYPQAIEYFERHIAHETEATGLEYLESQTFLYKGITHWRIGQIEEARAALELGHQIDPQNADLLFWLAQLFLSQGDLSPTESYLEQARRQFDLGYYNSRPYVEDFFQIYEADFDELAQKLASANH